MSKTKLNYEISDCYSYELNKIRNKLDQMECGRIYELSQAKMDGYLATNVAQLREMITDLLCKIQNGEDGRIEELALIMDSIELIDDN